MEKAVEGVWRSGRLGAEWGLAMNHPVISMVMRSELSRGLQKAQVRSIQAAAHTHKESMPSRRTRLALDQVSGTGKRSRTTELQCKVKL